MIPTAFKRYIEDDPYYAFNTELSYTRNIADLLNKQWYELGNFNAFYHCLPTHILGIKNANKKGSPSVLFLQEVLAQTRDYGVSTRCKFMV